MSEFVKDKTMVQDLHTVLEYLEYLADEAVLEMYKKDFYNVTKKCAATANRQLATAPDVMTAKLAGCSFTNKADIAFVQKKYRQVFESVVTKARKLAFEGMKWITKEQWAGFCSGVLPQCTHLEELNLNFNGNLEEDIGELVGKLPPTLKKLWLNDTGCFGDGGKAEWGRLPALETVWLHDTKVSGSEEELRAAGCKATRAPWYDKGACAAHTHTDQVRRSREPASSEQRAVVRGRRAQNEL